METSNMFDEITAIIRAVEQLPLLVILGVMLVISLLMRDL